MIDETMRDMLRATAVEKRMSANKRQFMGFDEDSTIAAIRAEATMLDEAAAALERMEAALQPFAREADEWHESAANTDAPFIGDYNPDGTLLPANFTVGDLRRARALVATTSPATGAEGEGNG